jgi:hypothetical protein
LIISETWIKLRSSAFFQPEVYFLNSRQYIKVGTNTSELSENQYFDQS